MEARGQEQRSGSRCVAVHHGTPTALPGGGGRGGKVRVKKCVGGKWCTNPSNGGGGTPSTVCGTPSTVCGTPTTLCGTPSTVCGTPTTLCSTDTWCADTWCAFDELLIGQQGRCPTVGMHHPYPCAAHIVPPPPPPL